MSSENPWGAGRKEAFEVVMLPAGVGVMAATPDQFRRVPVEAVDVYSARTHSEVEALADHHVVDVVPVGVWTAAEAEARRREVAARETAPDVEPVPR